MGAKTSFKCIFFFLLSLCCGVASASNILASDQSQIIQQINDLGSASVIVKYASPQISSQAISGLEGSELRNKIDLMRRGFVASLPTTVSSAISHEYDYVPGLVVSVDEQQLTALKDNKNVEAIYVNKRRSTNLLESVGVVYPFKNTLELDGEGWVTAVIDTGVDKEHSFFETDGSSRVISEACYSGGGFSSAFREISRVCPGGARVSTRDGSGKECSGFSGCDHGTHVAGIAAGNGGVASGAGILAIQVFTGIRDVFSRNVCGTGVGDSCLSAFDSDIIAGLERVYSLRNTYKIASVNMSLGGGRFFSSCNDDNSLMTGVIRRLKQAGIATIVSSGNDGFEDSISSPACISDAIAVGATSDFTGIVSFRQVTRDQRVFYSNSSAELDLYAPGTLIRSSVPNNGFANFNGTSMASPHVAGAFAVFRQAAPDKSVAELETILKSVGPKVTESGVTRRRLAVIGALRRLGVKVGVPMAPIYMLLEEPESD